jgi:hypothetical protein
MDMAEQNNSITRYRYVAAAVMLTAWSVGVLQLLGLRF